MKLLAVDTSGKILGVSLAQDKKILLEFSQFAEFNHSKILVKTVDMLLKQIGWGVRDIEKICVTTGPGSFTGIRIGISYARSLGQWLGVPVVGIPTLDILSKNVPRGDYLVVTAIDALNEMVFSAIYDGKSKKRISRYELLFFEDLIKKIKNKRCVFVGDALLNGMVFEKIKSLNSAVAPEYYKGVFFPKSSVLAVEGFERRGKKYSKVFPLYLKDSFTSRRQNPRRRSGCRIK